MKKIKRPTFEEMYDSYKKLIYIETYKHLKPLELIEESMQETMIKILKQYEKLADMDEAARRVYIGKIASGTATNFYYKEVAERKVLENSWEKVFADEIFPDIDEKRFSVLYSDKASRPNTPVNVIVGALSLIILMMRWLKILCWIFGSSMRCIQQVLRNSL